METKNTRLKIHKYGVHIHMHLQSQKVHLLATAPFCTVPALVTGDTTTTILILVLATVFNIHAFYICFPASSTFAVTD